MTSTEQETPSTIIDACAKRNPLEPIMNDSTNKEMYMFKEAWLNELANHPRYTFKNPVQTLYLGIDAYIDSIITLAVEDENLVIVSINSYKQHGSGLDIIQHINDLRAIQSFAEAPIEVLLDRSLSCIQADILAIALQKADKNLYVRTQDKKYGFQTHESEKQGYFEGLQAIMTENKLLFSDLVTEELKFEVIDQFKAYKRIVQTPEPEAKKSYYTAKNIIQRDDCFLVIVLSLVYLFRYRLD